MAAGVLERPTGGAQLSSSFAAASAVLITGVLIAWVALKLDVDPIDVPLHELAATSIGPSEIEGATGSDLDSQSLLDQAEMAFAAGRIVEPEFDNALSYYLAQLGSDPGNELALEGIDRVMGYLESETEGAIYRNDWDAARAYADTILKVRRSDDDAKRLKARIDRLERVEALSARALEQFAAGRLVGPRGDNAADTYREILRLDPNNEIARQGVRSVVQRLVASAQSAAFAGDSKGAARFVAAAKSLDPKAAGVAEVERSAREVQRANEDRDVQRDLMAAAEALQSDRLMPPAEPNAFELFAGVLARQPTSEAAAQGVQFVRDALVERLNARIGAGQVEGLEPMFADARKAGVDDEVLAVLDGDYRYAMRLADARAGRFDRLHPISGLRTLRKMAPAYPRGAASRGLEGWVDVEFTVTEDGEVRDATVTAASAEVFENAALAAVNRWRFEPVIEDGRPVPVRTGARFSFRDQ